MQDWQGNSRSVYSILGSSNHSNTERESNDFYATAPIAVDKLAGAVGFLPHKIWECACGEGHLSERLKSFGYEVHSSDLINRGYGEVADFLKAKKMPEDCTCILTNPPYKYALEFVLHSLKLLPDDGLCIMFLKTTFLEGQRRYEELFSKHPPMLVLQFSKRVICAKNGDFKQTTSSAVSYAWFVWKKGWQGDTVIRWI